MRKSMISDKPISDDASFIKLDQFLKFIGVVSTGGEAKALIQSGEVEVNGQMEIRRGRKLITGDRVSISSSTFDVNL